MIKNSKEAHMKTNNNLNKLEIFFEDNLNVKNLIDDMLPKPEDIYNTESEFSFVDRLLKDLEKIELYINRMVLNYNIPNDILVQFESKIRELQNEFNSESFYKMVKKGGYQGFIELRNFIHDKVSNMREEFVTSVYNGFVGYSCFYGENVLTPTTINEFLHYIHSYVINNEKFYFSIPTIRSTNANNTWGGISLRGVSNDFGNRLYEGIITSNINSDCIDIINLDKRILIMARDLGHATVIELEMNQDDVFVKYYIPKNTNKEMTGSLKGIYLNKNEFATGSFKTTWENIVQDLCDLMKGIPTDFDMFKSTFDK